MAASSKCSKDILQHKLAAANSKDGAARRRKTKSADNLFDLTAWGEWLSSFGKTYKACYKFVLLHHMAILLGILAMAVTYIVTHIKMVPAKSKSSHSGRSNGSVGGGTSREGNSLSRAAAKKPLPLKLLEAVSHKRLVVETRDYEVGGTFMRSLAEDGQPVLIKNSPVKSWDLHHRDLMELSDFMLKYTYLKSDKNPVFVFGNDRDKGGMLGSSKDVAIMGTNVKLGQFIHDTFDEGVYMIYQSDVETWERALANISAVGAWNTTVINEKSLDDPQPLTAVHLAHPSVVYHTRWSTRHLVINQVQGYNRVLIFQPGPGTAETEYLYPNIHRAYQYSQLHLEEYNATTLSNFYPKFRREGPAIYDITLQPGDSLYIPPYWLARQEYVTLSLSIHVESASTTQHSFSDAFAHNIPLGDFQSSQGLRGLGAALLLDEIVTRAAAHEDCLPKETTLQSLVASIVETRFKPFMSLHTAGKMIPSSVPETECFPSIESNPDVQEILLKNGANFETASSKVVSSICRAHAHASIKQRIIMDYVEQLIRWAISTHRTAAYLITCLSQDRLSKMLAEAERDSRLKRTTLKTTTTPA